jgi:cell wall-associated NlpC family hydrolase
MKSNNVIIVKKQIVLSTTSKKSNTGSSTLCDEIVAYALQFDGNPYKWGGTSLTGGTDCSGFTQSVFKNNGISIPRTSRSQAANGRKVPLEDIEPADLIFYRKNGIINHVAIYIGNGKVISARSPSKGINVSDYNYRKPYKAVSYIDRSR